MLREVSAVKLGLLAIEVVAQRPLWRAPASGCREGAPRRGAQPVEIQPVAQREVDRRDLVQWLISAGGDVHYVEL